MKGLTFAPQGRRTRGGFGAEGRVSPGGRPYYWVRHSIDNPSAGPEADSALCADGWVTITPMRPNYTCHETLAALR